MSLDKMEVAKATLQAIRQVLQKTPDQQKEGAVSVHMIDEFNALLKQIAEAKPELATALPRQITMRPPQQLSGISMIKFVELQIHVERIANLIHLDEKGK